MESTLKILLSCLPQWALEPHTWTHVFVNEYPLQEYSWEWDPTFPYWMIATRND